MSYLVGNPEDRFSCDMAHTSHIIKNLFLPYVKNKDTDQPADQHSI